LDGNRDQQIKPSNIFVDEGLEQVHIIDFGIATPLLKDGQFPVNATVLEGTLAYLAPEQTGRINRGIDERTDLYAIGVTLYEMLTGSLPFSSSDPGELLHCHIARPPRPPHLVRPSVPEVLSNIVLKLMNKMAEDRYQSARGLRADLETCLRAWHADQKLVPFALGTQERPTELRLPRKLYGRQAEQAQLLSVLERVRGGSLELALITGSAGVGKTEFVSELAHSLAEHGGYLARARFDQQQQAIPYGPLLGACRGLLRLLLTEPAKVVQTWRSRFLTVLGNSGQLLTELLPELELIIGAQPPVSQLPAVEAKNRFELLFQNFLRQFASAQHPLVLFLDDLQWADEASTQLLKQLLTDPYGHYLLVVGSYRAEALTETHPLRQTLESLRKERVATTVLELQPMGLAEVTSYLADALSLPPAEVADLASAVRSKTDGNPFFLGQFLGALSRDGLLRYSTEHQRWEWALPRIEALPATDNVADIMVAKLRQLSPQAMSILQIAACVGTQFELDVVAQLCSLPASERSEALAEAVRAGLLLTPDRNVYLADRVMTPPGSGSDAATTEDQGIVYKFLHERVQQSIYATLEPLKRQDCHLRLGRLRLAKWGPDASGGRLFELVNHLNLGSPRMREAGDIAGLLELARLNLAAGKRAKATAAFHAAVGFFTAGTALLPESAWSDHHDLLFELHLERAHGELLNGAFDDAEALLRSLNDRARTAIEHGLVSLRLCEQYYAQARFADSVRVGIEGLAQLGMVIPSAEEAMPALFAERAEIERLLAGRPIADLVNLPLNEDPAVDVMVRLIFALASPLYIAQSPQYPLLMMRQFTLALRHGLSAFTSYACAAYAFFLGCVLGEPAKAKELGEMALAMNERLTGGSMSCRIRLPMGSFMHFCSPFKESLAHYAKGREDGLACGDFSDLSLICSMQAQTSLYTTEDLNEALREVDESLVLMQRTKDALNTMQLRQVRQVLRAFVGRTEKPTSLNDADFDEAAEWASLRQGGIGYPLLLFSWLKTMALYHFGAYEEAYKLSLEAIQWLPSAPGLPLQTYATFMFCLALLGGIDKVPEAERAEAEAHIDRLHKQLDAYVGHCAANYRDRERLVAAERARLAGRSTEALVLYEEAITAAHRNGFPLHEALAQELAGRFHAFADRAKLATYYLTEALYAYLHIGATAKARALLSEHPELLRSESRSMLGLGRNEATTRGTTSSASSHTTDDHIDVNSVLRASEVISRERALDKTIDQILHTVLTSAGVQRGYLLLNRGGTLQIEASRSISPDDARTSLGIPLDSLGQPGGPSENMALSVVHYVVRTREVVALSTSVIDPRFANDAYLRSAKPYAVLCLPLVSQGQLTGILYLENNLAQVTFSPARIDLLRILAGQAATALENALLLQRIQEATEKVHRTNEVLEAQVAERTAQIQRSNSDLQAANERLQIELAERTRAEQERAELQEQMLQAQRERLAEMSTPLIPITPRIMVMPLIGTVDSERASQIIEVALNGTQQSGAKVVILDITGLRHIDTSIAGSLLKTARALRLLGSHAILTGIRASVAQTLVGLGVELNILETRSTLQSAIAYALRHTGESLVIR
jgi:predicted ATPase/anti-anti-sigma regulatory factor/GAF domain-containing protein